MGKVAGWSCRFKAVLFDVYFCFFSGQSAAEGAEFEANGGVHVQCAEATGIWRRFSLACPVYRLIDIFIIALTRFVPHKTTCSREILLNMLVQNIFCI